jgi:hypothetical protein
MVVNLVRIVHDCWEASYYLLCFGCPKGHHPFSSFYAAPSPSGIQA